MLSSSLKTREDDYGVCLVFGNPRYILLYQPLVEQKVCNTHTHTYIYICVWGFKQQPSDLQFLRDIGGVGRKHIMISWRVPATRGLWDGKLRGQSAEDAFRDTEVHKTNQGRLLWESNVCFLWCLQSHPSSCALFNRRPGNHQCCLTPPNSFDVLQNIYLKNRLYCRRFFCNKRPVHI